MGNKWLNPEEDCMNYFTIVLWGLLLAFCLYQLARLARAKHGRGSAVIFVLIAITAASAMLDVLAPATRTGEAVQVALSVAFIVLALHQANILAKKNAELEDQLRRDGHLP
jgi:hypothetical protein